MLPEGLSYRDGRLVFDGADLERLAMRYGTPLYVYSADRVRAKLARLNRAFGGIKPLVCYAMKSNATLAPLLAKAGTGVEVVSGGELYLAKKAGYSMKKTIFSGVGKTLQEIREALHAGILLFNVESLDELGMIEREAARLRKRAPVAIRLNPDIDARTHRHITTAKAENKFGIPVREGLHAFCLAAASPHLEAKGLHVHLGSQILSPTPYRRAAVLLKRLLAELEESGHPVEYLDIGGGMGVPFEGRMGLDMTAVAKAVRPLAKGRKIIVEPGRYLVAEAGLLLTQVLHVKKGRRRLMSVVDAGMTDLIRPALYDARHPLIPIRKQKGGVKFEMVGPICESADAFGPAAGNMPKRGDLWAILTAGAYGFSMSSQYNGRPRPAEIIVSKGRASIARPRESYRDLA